MTSPARRPSDSALAARLRGELEGEVLFDSFSRGLYSTDASIYQIEPTGIVVPRTTADVFRTLEIASEAGLSVTPRGAGTSQSGQAIGEGLVMDTSKYLNKIGELDREAATIRVQPGVVLDRLNQELKPHGQPGRRMRPVGTPMAPPWADRRGRLRHRTQTPENPGPSIGRRLS